MLFGATALALVGCGSKEGEDLPEDSVGEDEVGTIVTSEEESSEVPETEYTEEGEEFTTGEAEVSIQLSDGTEISAEEFKSLAEEEGIDTSGNDKTGSDKALIQVNVSRESESVARERLENGDFTEEEITYALENTDTDFNENAVEQLDDYLFMQDGSVSEDEKSSFLEEEGYTPGQVQYAIANQD